jgi:hypothetical protein
MWVVTTNREYVNVSDALKITIEGLSLVALYPDGQKLILATALDTTVIERCFNLIQISMEKPGSVCQLQNIVQGALTQAQQHY